MLCDGSVVLCPAASGKPCAAGRLQWRYAGLSTFVAPLRKSTEKQWRHFFQLESDVQVSAKRACSSLVVIDWPQGEFWGGYLGQVVALCVQCMRTTCAEAGILTQEYLSPAWSVWLKLRASLYEAQIGLGARLVSANSPPLPCASLAPTPPPPPVRLVSAKLPPPPCASLAPNPPPCASLARQPPPPYAPPCACTALPVAT